MDALLPYIGAAVVVAVVAFFCRFQAVPRTQIIVLERLGTVTRSVTNTIFFYRPLERARTFNWSWDGVRPSPRTSLPLTEQVLDPAPLSVRAQSYPCKVDILVRYRIVDPAHAVETSDDPLRATMVTAQSRLRAVASSHSWSELDRSRGKIAAELRDYINGTTDTKYGISITEVVIEGITVSKEVEKTFQRDAELEASMRTTRKRRELQLYEEETKTKVLEAELARERLRNSTKAAELGALSSAGVDVSSYLLAQSYEKLADALSQSSVTTLVLGQSGGGLGGPFGLGCGNVTTRSA